MNKNYIDEVSEWRKLNRKLIGRRIECVRMNDPYPIPSGTKGTVSHVDDVGTIHVKWDNGSILGLAHGVDEYRLI